MHRLLAVAAALVAIGVAAVLSFGSSHREAPNILLDPTGDNTDVYAFTAKNAPGALTVVANWIPLEDPAGGPNFYNFDPKAHYYIRIDNTGDGKPDVSYRYEFKTTVRNKNSFLFALPGVSSFNDPKLNVVQTYSIFRETVSKKGKETSRRIAKNLPVAPSNVGPKVMPTTARSPLRPTAGSPAEAEPSPARSRIRSTSTWGRHSTTSTSARRPETPARARTTWRATTPTRSSCRSPRVT